MIQTERRTPIRRLQRPARLLAPRGPPRWPLLWRRCYPGLRRSGPAAGWPPHAGRTSPAGERSHRHEPAAAGPDGVDDLLKGGWSSIEPSVGCGPRGPHSRTRQGVSDVSPGAVLGDFRARSPGCVRRRQPSAGRGHLGRPDLRGRAAYGRLGRQRGQRPRRRRRPRLRVGPGRRRSGRRFDSPSPDPHVRGAGHGHGAAARRRSGGRLRHGVSGRHRRRGQLPTGSRHRHTNQEPARERWATPYRARATPPTITTARASQPAVVVGGAEPLPEQLPYPHRADFHRRGHRDVPSARLRIPVVALARALSDRLVGRERGHQPAAGSQTRT
jgi:hypothetical protein